MLNKFLVPRSNVSCEIQRTFEVAIFVSIETPKQVKMNDREQIFHSEQRQIQLIQILVLHHVVEFCDYQENI